MLFYQSNYFGLYSFLSQDTSSPAPVREIIKEVSTQVFYFEKKKKRRFSYKYITKFRFIQPQTDYSGDMSDFRTALQRLREELDRLKQLVQDLINKSNLSVQDIDVS